MNLMKPLVTSSFILGSLALVGCSDTNLARPAVVSDSIAGINFCTTPAQSVVTNLKYIFVFDHSGSNNQNYLIVPNAVPASGSNPAIPATCAGVGSAATPVVEGSITICQDPDGGTDPTGTKRFPPLVQFLQSTTDNANTFYASINFSDAPALYFPWTDAKGNRTTAAQAALNFEGLNPKLGTEDGWLTPITGAPVADNTAPNDGGNTDYEDTLGSAGSGGGIYNMIAADVQAQAAAAVLGQPIVSSDYVIIWISDGAPYVNGNLQSAATIYGEVQAIMALQTANPQFIDSITLNTGFYSTADEYLSSEYNTAMTIMSTMATWPRVLC